MATIRDVARRARVSAAAAARALGGYGYASARTRQKVLRAAHALDYHRNGIARSMTTGHTSTVAVIVSDNANPFFASVVRGVEDTVLAHGYGVILCNADEDPEKEALYLRAVRERRVDGLIISPSSRVTDVLRSVVRTRLPVVQIDRRLEELDADAVIIDNRAGVRLAVEHLLRLGHRRIAMIGGPRRLYTGRERLEGFVDALGTAGIPVATGWIQEGDFKARSGHALARRLLEHRPWPAALFVANNLMTIGALLGLKEARIRVPEEIAVVGFDDMDWAPIVTPPLTAVAQPSYALGATAGQLLVQRIRRPSGRPPQTIVFQPRLVVRDSCGAHLAQRMPGAPES